MRIFRINHFLVLFFGVILSSCASQNRDLHQRLVSDIANKNLKEAIKVVESKDFYGDKNSRLLAEIEKGSVYYRAKRNLDAEKSFGKADSISKELFTKSVKSKILSAFNDKNSVFDGRDYELSYLKFYRAINNYNLFVNGKENLSDYSSLNLAKSNLEEQHDLFRQLSIKNQGKPVYKYDLLSNLFAAFLYEQDDTPENMQIALSLYKEIKREFFYNYNIYPVFNLKSNEFIKNYSNFSNMDLNSIKSRFVEQTGFTKNLLLYVDNKIKHLSEFKKDNTFFIIKEGLVAEKKAKQYNFGFSLDKLMKLSYFASFLSKNREVDKLFVSSFIYNNLMDSFEYELPFINKKNVKNLSAEFMDSSGKIYNIPLVLAAPVSDFAYNDIYYSLDDEKAALISRLVVEYLGAAFAAYKIYEASNNAGAFGNVFAIMSAVSSFKLAAKLIKESNKVDLRQWKTLPNAIYVSSYNFPVKSNYTLKIYDKDNNQILKSVPISIDDKNHNFVDIDL